MKKSGTNKLLSMILAILMVFNVVAPVTGSYAAGVPETRTGIPVDGNGEDPGYGNPGSIGLKKSAEWIDDGTAESKYAEVKLNVEGIPMVGEGVDTILLIDNSGSMGSTSTPGSRINTAKDASKEFIDIMFEKNFDDTPSKNRVSFIKFDSGASTESGLVDYNSKETLKGLVNTKLGVSMGSTNYTAGFSNVKAEIEKQGSSKREKHVIFMTDGAPDNSTYETVLSELKGMDVKIHSVGLELNGDTTKNRLKAISSGEADFYHDVKTKDQLVPAFKNIADSLKKAASGSVIVDEIEDKYFELITSPIIVNGKALTAPTVEKGSVEVGSDEKTINWNLGDVLNESRTMTYYLKIKDNVQRNNIYPTSKQSAKITYTNFNDNYVYRLFNDTSLAYPGGQIEIVSYLVNKEGKPLGTSGNVVPDDKIMEYANKLDISKFQSNGSDFLPFGKYLVDTKDIIEVDGKSYQLHASFNPQYSFDLKPGNSAIKLFLGYTELEEVEYKVNYLDEKGQPLTESVSGKGRVGSELKAEEKKFDGYRLVNATPSSTIKLSAKDKNEITMKYEVDPNQKYDYTIKHLNESGEEIAPIETGKLSIKSELSAAEKVITGYKYKSASPSKTINIISGKNEIVMTYEIDKNQLFDYEIRYYMDKTTSPALGVDTFLTDYNKATGKIVGKGYLGQDISVRIPTGAQLNNGYGPVSTNPTDVLTNGNFKTTIDKNKNIVTVNYGIDKNVKLDYKITYYILDDKKSEIAGLDSLLTKNAANNETYAAKEFTGKGHLGEKITIQQPDIKGLSGYGIYKLQDDISKEITLKAGVNELEVYYVRDRNATADYSISYVDENGLSIKDLDGNIQVQDITGNGRIDSRKVVPQPVLEGYKVRPGQATMMTVTGDSIKDNIEVVYEKQNYDYQINYLIAGSNKPIPGLTGEKGNLPYGNKVSATITDQYLPSGSNINNAEYILSSDQKTELQVSASNSKNILNIYYNPTSVEVNISFLLKDTTTKIHKDVKIDRINGNKLKPGDIVKVSDVFAATGVNLPAYYKLQDKSYMIEITTEGNMAVYFRR